MHNTISIFKSIQVIKVIAIFGIVAFASFYFGGDVSAQTRGWNTTAVAGSGANLPAGSIEVIITYFMLWLLRMVAVLAIISFIISGIMYLLASANESLMEKGKNGIKYSIIGFTVAISGLIIIKEIYCLLTIGSFTAAALNPLGTVACIIDAAASAI